MQENHLKRSDVAFDLTGKTAVITGASSGLGASMVLALSEHGAIIAVLDIKDKEGGELVKKLKTKSKFYHVDVSNESELKQTVNSIKEDFGKIDILINNAGIFYPTPIESTSKEDWEKLMSVNVTGCFLMTKHCLPLMQSGGRIINISSVAGHHAFANSTAYNSSKGAVIQMTKSMAVEYASKGINVNAICPGVFATPMTDALLESKEMQDTIQRSVLLKRAGNSDELNGLAVYLASDECSYMTGSIITVDGGWTCHL